VQHNKISNGICRPIALILAAASLTACGSESTAASNAAQGNTATHAATTVAAVTPAAAPTALPPAALTAWETFARGQCRDQGERFAAVRFAPLAGRGEAVDLVEQHFAGDAGGFVSADFNADGTPDFVVTTPGYGCVSSGPAYGDQGPPVDFIVSTASGYRVFDGFMGWIAPAMIARRGDRGVLDLPGGFNGRCGPVTTVTWGWTGNDIDAVERRNDSGQLVDREGCAVSAQRPVKQGGGGSFPPIEPGYWAAGGTCSEVIADALEIPIDQTGLSHFIEKQGWSGRFEVLRYSALGGNRWRMHGREHTEIGKEPGHRDIVVNSRTSFTELGEFGGGYTHCPTSQIPRSLRGEFEQRYSLRQEFEQ
jgi:hypothetical protein